MDEEFTAEAQGTQSFESEANVNFTKSEHAMLRQAASGKFQQTQRWEWLMWLNATMLSIGVAVKVIGETTSLNLALGMMTISFFCLVILLVRFKCKALGLIRKLYEQSGEELNSASSAPLR